MGGTLCDWCRQVVDNVLLITSTNLLPTPHIRAGLEIRCQKIAFAVLFFLWDDNIERGTSVTLQEVFIKTVGRKLLENIKGVAAGPSDGIKVHHSAAAALQCNGSVWGGSW